MKESVKEGMKGGKIKRKEWKKERKKDRKEFHTFPPAADTIFARLRATSHSLPVLVIFFLFLFLHILKTRFIPRSSGLSFFWIWTVHFTLDSTARLLHSSRSCCWTSFFFSGADWTQRAKGSNGGLFAGDLLMLLLAALHSRVSNVACSKTAFVAKGLCFWDSQH